MSDYLIAPFEGELFDAKSIDKADTEVHEDLIKITRKHGMIQVDVACLVPPTEYVREESVFDALCHELETTHDSQPSGFLSREVRIKYSLNETTPKQVIVATYVLDDMYKIILEELSISSAVVSLQNYNDYSKTKDCLHSIDDLLKIIHHRPGLDIYARMWHEKLLGPDWKPADYLVTMALQLFNMTCRNAARKKGVVFIDRPKPSVGRDYFTIGGSYSVFNRCLRDPTAFVNASNLSNYFLSLPIFYTQKFLKKGLPLGKLK